MYGDGQTSSTLDSRPALDRAIPDPPTSLVHFMDQAQFIARSPRGAVSTSTAQAINNSRRHIRDDIFVFPNQNLSRLSLAQLPSAEEILKADRAFYEADAKPPFVCKKEYGQAHFTAWLADGRGHRTTEPIEVYPKHWSPEYRYWQTTIDGYECIVKKCVGGCAGFHVRLWLGHERGLDDIALAHPASRSLKALCSMDATTPATKPSAGAVKSSPLNTLAKGKKPSFGLLPSSTKKRPRYREPSLSSDAEENYNFDDRDHVALTETIASTRTRRTTKKARPNYKIPPNPEVSHNTEPPPAENSESRKPTATPRPVSVKKRKQQTTSQARNSKRTLPHSNDSASTTVHKPTETQSRPEAQGWHAPLAPPKPPPQSDTQTKKEELARREREIRKSLQALLYEDLRDIKAQQEQLAQEDED
ncbi:MAG: hypothetical protein Q9200_004608 [Gallowayella weberi]